MGSFPAATRYQLQNYRWRWAPVLAGRKWVPNSSLDRHGSIMGPNPALFFSFYPSIHRFLTPASLTSRIRSRRYLLGWLL